MSEVEQLERRIENLSPEELAKLRAWFMEFDASVWDDQTKADARAGWLDRLINNALADYESANPLSNGEDCVSDFVDRRS